jgi:23S rRNA pseudouridine1911/1915/1917 synthase
MRIELPVTLFPARLPAVVAQTASYIVLYKPPRMHSVPLKEYRGPTLLSWCAGLFPEVLRVRGRNLWEGGLVHRLDYETQGLVLAARDQGTFDALASEQEAGRFVKEYRAVSCRSGETLLAGFPQRPVLGAPPVTVASGFRAFGPGRKVVRPDHSGVFDQGLPYCTEILDLGDEGGLTVFRVRLYRGFRHQIRCHLAWLGYPLLNDPLYGGAALSFSGALLGGLPEAVQDMALCATALTCSSFSPIC